MSTDGRFVYLKYWKPRGVTSTSDPSDPTNIIKAGAFNMFPQRLFTVGRLDKDSTGLILLTSDGRVNNAMLRPSLKKEKVQCPPFCRAAQWRRGAWGTPPTAQPPPPPPQNSGFLSARPLRTVAVRAPSPGGGGGATK